LRERRYDREHESIELITVRTARLDDLVPDGADVSGPSLTEREFSDQFYSGENYYFVAHP